MAVRYPSRWLLYNSHSSLQIWQRDDRQHDDKEVIEGAPSFLICTFLTLLPGYQLKLSFFILSPQPQIYFDLHLTVMSPATNTHPPQSYLLWQLAAPVPSLLGAQLSVLLHPCIFECHLSFATNSWFSNWVLLHCSAPTQHPRFQRHDLQV